jgi:hypothetical protein
MDYKCFGDVVSFDTTFQTNKFEMPFAPRHKQTIIFGAVLLFDETILSFGWLFWLASIQAQFLLIKI